MKAKDLYQKLESDFITPAMSDEWAHYMQLVAGFLTENYRNRSMGLVCDHTLRIEKVYTAVFPSPNVMQNILDRNETEILLFLHHPENWDLRQAPNIFQNMDPRILQQFKDRKISIYNLHVPLDAYGPYSTCVSLAKILGIEEMQPFAMYYGVFCGILGTTPFTSIDALHYHFTRRMGHRTSLYQYGLADIKNRRVALAAGGGNLVSILEEIAGEGINTYITGVTVRNERTEPSHRFAIDHGINLLGGTHYSTEKPACVAMCGYFEKAGLPSEFIEGTPSLEDL
jgi:putative NIF3 family GTP cyclohydrolase 1 type 2